MQACNGDILDIYSKNAVSSSLVRVVKDLQYSTFLYNTMLQEQLPTIPSNLKMVQVEGRVTGSSHIDADHVYSLGMAMADFGKTD